MFFFNNFNFFDFANIEFFFKTISLYLKMMFTENIKLSSPLLNLFEN